MCLALCASTALRGSDTASASRFHCLRVEDAAAALCVSTAFVAKDAALFPRGPQADSAAQQPPPAVHTAVHTAAAAPEPEGKDKARGPPASHGLQLHSLWRIPTAAVG